MTTENAIEDSLARVGLDAGIPAPTTEMRTTSHENATAGHPEATRWAVVSGDVIRLVLSDECNPLANIVLGPADCVAVASDLLNAARICCGR